MDSGVNTGNIQVCNISLGGGGGTKLGIEASGK